MFNALGIWSYFDITTAARSTRGRPAVNRRPRFLSVDASVVLCFILVAAEPSLFIIDSLTAVSLSNPYGQGFGSVHKCLLNKQ